MRAGLRPRDPFDLDLRLVAAGHFGFWNAVHSRQERLTARQQRLPRLPRPRTAKPTTGSLPRNSVVWAPSGPPLRDFVF